MTSTEQTALHPPNDPDTPATVYVVVTNYADDPHPHVEEVFEDEEAADELMERCRSVTKPPHPVAWRKVEKEVLE